MVIKNVISSFGVFVTASHFHPSLLFTFRALAYQSGPPNTWTANIRLRLKSQTSNNNRLLNGACFLHQYCKWPQQKNPEKKPIMSCASSGHITKLKQYIFRLSISMVKVDSLYYSFNCGRKKFYRTRWKRTTTISQYIILK